MSKEIKQYSLVELATKFKEAALIYKASFKGVDKTVAGLTFTVGSHSLSTGDASLQACGEDHELAEFIQVMLDDDSSEDVLDWAEELLKNKETGNA